MSVKTMCSIKKYNVVKHHPEISRTIISAILNIHCISLILKLNNETRLRHYQGLAVSFTKHYKTNPMNSSDTAFAGY